MSARELTVLGTESQVPTRHRNQNGCFLRWDQEAILFDQGRGDAAAADDRRPVAEARTVHADVTAAVEPDAHADPTRRRAQVPQRT